MKHLSFTDIGRIDYGVGGTIDYVKSNETAKQLPDKYIKALDKWVENLTKEENQKRNGNESK